jgi:hypothetical protein
MLCMVSVRGCTSIRFERLLRLVAFKPRTGLWRVYHPPEYFEGRRKAWQDVSVERWL